VGQDNNRKQRKRRSNRGRDYEALQYDGAGSGAGVPTGMREERPIRITSPAARRQSRPDVMNASW
jgi:hypothetical protein